jgi:hypothetical protein
MAVADTVSQGGPRMWPSIETATRISDAANWILIASLAVGMISIIVIMWMASVRKAEWEADHQSSQATIVKLGAAIAAANARASDAGASAADANARAAEAASAVLDANARVAEAEAALALAKFKAPRTLTSEQQSHIVEKLRPLTPAPYDVTVAEGAEPASLTKRVEDMLKQAKWTLRDPAGSMVGSGPAKTDAFIPDGVSIEIAESKRADWEPTVIALVLALRAEGIYANGTASSTADAAAIHVKIGNKPQDGPRGQQSQHIDRREEATQGAN